MQLKIENLTKTIGNSDKRIKLDFELLAGDTLVILGENSAGKTSFMRLLAGYLDADSGKIILNGKDFKNKIFKFQQKIGYLPEALGFDENLYSEDFLHFMATIKGIKNQKTDWRLEQTITQLGLKSKLKTKIGKLSKGFKQRLALAGVLLNDPKILILDEPTQGLDFDQKQKIYKILLKRCADGGINIISTHYIEEALEIANKILVLHDFKVLFFDDKKSIISEAENFYTSEEFEKKQNSNEYFLNSNFSKNSNHKVEIFLNHLQGQENAV